MRGLVLIQMVRLFQMPLLPEKLHATYPEHAAAALGYAYGRNNQREKALEILRELDEVASKRTLPPLEKALVYRLAMMLTGQSSIQDVLFFPQMRPEKG